MVAYSLSETSICIQKPRLIPLTEAIIKTMTHFTSISTESFKVQNPEQFKQAISNEIEKAIQEGIKSLPGVEHLLRAKSLNDLINKCLWSEDSSTIFKSLLRVRDQNEKHSVEDCSNLDSFGSREEVLLDNPQFSESEKKSRNQSEKMESNDSLSEQVDIEIVRNWSKLKKSIKLLDQKAKLLEQEIVCLMSSIPEWDKLNLKNLNIDVNTIVDKFSDFVDKSFNDAMKALALKKIGLTPNVLKEADIKQKKFMVIPEERQSDENAVRDNVSLDEFSSTKAFTNGPQMRIHQAFKTSPSEDSLKNLRPRPSRSDSDIHALEHYTSFFNRKQYKLNTKYMPKSETTVFLNNCPVVIIPQIPSKPLKGKRPPLAKLVTKNADKYEAVKAQ